MIECFVLAATPMLTSTARREATAGQPIWYMCIIVLILGGHSEIGAHPWREIVDLYCLREAAKKIKVIFLVFFLSGPYSPPPLGFLKAFVSIESSTVLKYFKQGLNM